MSIKIGSPVWIFDRDQSAFDSSGKRLGFRGQWVAETVSGETRQSWLIGTRYKIKKTDITKTCKTSDCGYGGVFMVLWDVQSAVDYQWASDNREKIVEQVRRIAIKDLLKIAEIIEYKQ